MAKLGTLHVSVHRKEAQDKVVKCRTEAELHATTAVKLVTWLETAPSLGIQARTIVGKLKEAKTSKSSATDVAKRAISCVTVPSRKTTVSREIAIGAVSLVILPVTVLMKTNAALKTSPWINQRSTEREEARLALTLCSQFSLV